MCVIALGVLILAAVVPDALRQHPEYENVGTLIGEGVRSIGVGVWKLAVALHKGVRVILALWSQAPR